jgi:hypothetical protein
MPGIKSQALFTYVADTKTRGNTTFHSEISGSHGGKYKD